MQRKAHATPDLLSRDRKARKIERLLQLPAERPVRLLEIGTGSGGIAHYFGTHHSRRFDVHAVDVRDDRRVREGYEFHVVADTRLPFPAGCFDAVISNHVIEHVGGRGAQLRHLREIRRVLRSDGRGYLAVPNRWMLIEPHYGLPFLSWLPRALRSPYLAISGRGVAYDCEPLQQHELHALLARAGLDYEHRETEALRALAELERDDRLARLMAMLPSWLITVFRPALPTFICTLSPPAPSDATD